MEIDQDLSLKLGSLFKRDHPLSILVRERGAKLVINPHVVVNMMSEKPGLTDPVVAFVRTQGSVTELVEVPLGEEKLVGFKVVKEDASSLELRDGTRIGVFSVGGLLELLQYAITKTEEGSRKEAEIVRQVERRKKSVLPPMIQEINKALFNQSPKLGDLEIRSSGLSRKLFTIHESGSVNNGLSSVSMYNVDKFTKTNQGKIKKTKSTRHVVGFYLANDHDFTKPELMIKAIDDLKRKLSRRKHKSGAVASFGMEKEIDIAVVTEDQLKVWRSANFFTELVAYKDKAAPLDKIYDLLRKQVGDGVQIQVQHVTNGEADLVFVPDGARLPSELSSFSVAIGGIGEETKYLEHVVGIMSVADGLLEKEKKNLAAKVSKSLRLLYTSKSFDGKMPNILAVDNKLLKYWQQKAKDKEAILIPRNKSGLESALSDPEHHESVGRSDVEAVNFYSYEPNKPGIGAKFMQLIVKYGDGHEERLTLDQGAQFDNFPWDGMSKPSFASGITSYENYLPPDQVKFWRRTLELRQMQEQGGRFFEPDNPVARDLSLRVGMEKFLELAAQMGYGGQRNEIRRKFHGLVMPNIHHLGVVYTHGHVDHFGWGGLISTNVPVITSDASIPFFETMFRAGSGGFASEAIFRRERDTLMTKSSRKIITPPLYLPEPYQEIRLGRGQVGVTLLPVSHSIHGGVMAKVVIYDQADKPIKTIVYTGDFNFDNRAMMDETEKYLMDVDAMIVDTTNIRKDAYRKPSVGVTREIMEEAYTKMLTNTNKSSLVEMAWHNMEDVEMIRRIASETGQSVYVYPKMAILLHLIHELDETRQKSIQTYDWREHNPVPRLGAGVLPWIYPKMTYRSGERMLMENMEVATHASLSSAGQHVLFVPPNPMLESTMLNANTHIYENVVRGHYWPYGSNDKSIVRNNFAFTRRSGLNYLTDLELRNGNIYPSSTPKYHMSGHARPEDTLALVRRLSHNGMLRQIVPNHGDARTFAAEEIRKQHPDLVVYDRFAKNGFVIQLYSRE